MFLAAGQLCGSTLLTLPLVFVEHPSLAHLAAPAWWAWIGLAIPSAAFAFVLYFRILATAGRTGTLVITGARGC